MKTFFWLNLLKKRVLVLVGKSFPRSGPDSGCRCLFLIYVIRSHIVRPVHIVCGPELGGCGLALLYVVRSYIVCSCLAMGGPELGCCGPGLLDVVRSQCRVTARVMFLALDDLKVDGFVRC